MLRVQVRNPTHVQWRVETWTAEIRVEDTGLGTLALARMRGLGAYKDTELTLKDEVKAGVPEAQRLFAAFASTGFLRLAVVSRMRLASEPRLGGLRWPLVEERNATCAARLRALPPYLEDLACSEPLGTALDEVRRRDFSPGNGN